MATITASRRGVLDDHVISASGPWSECSGCREANLLRLRDPEDEVVLQGPVDVNVSVYAEDELTAATGKVTVTRQPLMSHDISIPVGSSWRYGIGLLRGVGGNAGCTAWIRTARPQPDPLLVAAQDLPCDFAVRSIADTGEFFPSPCDPCEGGPVRVPPLDCGPAVDVLAARGGCVLDRATSTGCSSAARTWRPNSGTSGSRCGCITARPGPAWCGVWMPRSAASTW